MSDATAADATAADAPDDSGREEDAPHASRFRGGDRSSGSRTLQRRFSARNRRLGPILLLAVLLVLAGVLVWWAVFRFHDRPTLLAAAVPQYRSALVPPNAFAADDLRLLAALPTVLSDGGRLLTDAAGLRLFVDRTIPTTEADTLVVYLNAHGLTDATSAFLLPAGTADPGAGVPLARLVKRLAHHPAARKLLVLDATKVGVDLGLGSTGTDLPELLAELLARNPGDGTLAVLCSSTRSRAWAAPDLRQTPFALAVATALAGSPRADADGDGVVTADELGGFVRGQVAAWSARHRGVKQVPLYLPGAGDFPLCAVDPRDLVPTQPDDPAGESDKPAKPALTPQETADKVLDTLGGLWDTPAAPAADGAALARHVAIAARLRAERLLLAGEAAAADRLLADEGTTRAAAEPVPEWSAATLPEPSEGAPSPAAAAVAAALQAPTDDALAALARLPLAEPPLVIALAPAWRSGDGWTDAKRVRRAYALRLRASRLAAGVTAALLPWVREDFAVADALRRRAEYQLSLGRSAEAPLELAAAGLDRLERTLARRRGQCRQLTDTLERTPYVVAALGAERTFTAGAGAPVAACWQSLWDSAHGIDAIPEQYAGRTLDRLAAAAADCDRAWTLHRQETRLAGRRSQAYALLAVPPDDGGQRVAVLRDLLTRAEPLPEDAVAEDVAADGAGPAQPFPLTGMLLGMPETAGANTAARRAAGDRLRTRLATLRATPALATGDSPWHRWLAGRSTAGLRAAGLLDYTPRSRPAALDVDAVLHAAYVEWLGRRVAEDARNLSPRPYPGSDAAPPLPAPSSGRLAKATATPDVRPVVGQAVVAPLDLMTAVPAGAAAVLTLDWPAAADRLAVTAPQHTATGGPGWLRVPLEVPAQGTLSVPMRSAHTAAEPPLDTPLAVDLRVRLEYPAAPPDWLNARVVLQPRQVRPARLHVATGGIDLLPGRKVAFDVTATAAVAGPLSLRLAGERGTLAEFPLVAAEPNADASKQAAADAPVTLRPQVPAAYSLPLPPGRLDWELVAADEIVRRLPLRATVLDPAAAVTAETRYDDRSQRLAVTLARRTSDAASGPVPVSLTLRSGGEPVPTTGIAAGELAADAPTTLQVRPVEVVAGPLEAWVEIAGTPRTYRYRFSPGTPLGVRLRDTAVAVLSPADGAVYATDAAALPVRLSGEANGTARLKAGIDRNGDGVLQAAEVQHRRDYPHARQAELTLSHDDQAKPPAPPWTLAAAAGDIAFPLAVRGLQGRQRLLVELTDTGNRRQATAAATLYFIADAPALTLKRPAGATPLTVPVGQTAAVTAEVPRLTGTVAAVRWGIDRNGNGRWDDSDTVVPLGADGAPLTTPLRPDRDGRVRTVLDTTALPAGRYRVFARTAAEPAPAQRTAGQEPSPPLLGPIAEGTLAVTAPPEPPPPTGPGRIVGKVTVSGQPWGFVRVSVTGTDLKTETGPDGKFSFDEVPPGKTTVRAKTNSRSGQAEVEVKSGKTATLDLPISLSGR